MELPNAKTQMVIMTIFIFLVSQILPTLAQTHIHHYNHDMIQSEDQEFLNEHNRVRRQASEPSFLWDPQIAAYARKWANERIKDCHVIHSKGPYGENIFWGALKHWNPTDAVKSWANEYKYYNTKDIKCKPGKMCGHYTQLVWRDSTKLGCARVECKNGGVLAICNYDPPGNYEGEDPFVKFKG